MNLESASGAWTTQTAALGFETRLRPLKQNIFQVDPAWHGCLLVLRISTLSMSDSGYGVSENAWFSCRMRCGFSLAKVAGGRTQRRNGQCSPSNSKNADITNLTLARNMLDTRPRRKIPRKDTTRTRIPQVTDQRCASNKVSMV